MAAKVVLITGVSQGLGRAMAEGFIERGDTVIGCARSKDAIDELSAMHPSPHRFSVVDVADDDSVRRWAEGILKVYAAPDLLLNNAALINANASLWEVPVGEFSKLIDVNIKGVFHVIRHFVPAMIEQGRGVVVNFSSGWGRSTSSDVAPYCATKFAIEGLTGAMAAELPSGLAAVSLNPGIIHTEMLESCFGEHASAYPNPQEWASSAVPFLAGLKVNDNGAALTVP